VCRLLTHPGYLLSFTDSSPPAAAIAGPVPHQGDKEEILKTPLNKSMCTHSGHFPIIRSACECPDTDAAAASSCQGTASDEPEPPISPLLTTGVKKEGGGGLHCVYNRVPWLRPRANVRTLTPRLDHPIPPRHTAEPARTPGIATADNRCEEKRRTGRCVYTCMLHTSGCVVVEAGRDVLTTVVSEQRFVHPTKRSRNVELRNPKGGN
jgi:hypothetical protein